MSETTDSPRRPDPVPTSGRPEELLRWAQIDRDQIARTARALIAGTPEHVRRAA